MGIPYAMNYEVTATGYTVKFVTCEQCNSEFVYQMGRAVTGKGVSLLFLDNQGAQDSAKSQAESGLHDALQRGCDPVPCPSCGWYKKDMVPEFQGRLHRWMTKVGVGCLVVSGIVLGTLILGSIVERRPFLPRDPERMVEVISVLVVPAIFGVALIALRPFLAKLRDPNAADLAIRLELGRQLAVTKRDWDNAAAKSSGDIATQ